MRKSSSQRRRNSFGIVAAVVIAVGCVATVCCAARGELLDDGEYHTADERGDGQPLSELVQSVLDEASTEAEREAVLVEKEKVKRFRKNITASGFTSAGLKAITDFSTIDYFQEPAALARNIADAVIPIIANGLALIPVAGALISGVFSGLWGLFSALYFGGEDGDQDSRMEKMLKDAIEKSERKTDEKLKKLLTGSIHGELVRNGYVCDKYALIAGNFSKNLARAGWRVNDTYRLEMIMFLDNCDNFLKDTAEAFDHPDYADVLWVPSAMTTLSRVSFLADVITYGHALRIPESIVHVFYGQLRHNIRQHYNLHARGMTQRANSIDSTRGLNGEEMAACKMQSTLLYFDRGLYPYGVPNRTIGSQEELRVIDESVFALERDPSTRKLKEYKHVQIFNDGTFKEKTHGYYRSSILLNCYLGLTVQKLSQNQFYLQTVNYIPNYSYTVRVIYFNQKAQYGSFYKRTKGKLIKSAGNDIEINVSEQPENANEPVTFEVDATYLMLDNCRALPINEKLEFQPCLGYTKKLLWEGKLVIDEIDTVNVRGDGRGSFKATSNVHRLTIWFYGVEFIVGRYIK